MATVRLIPNLIRLRIRLGETTEVANPTILFAQIWICSANQFRLSIARLCQTAFIVF